MPLNESVYSLDPEELQFFKSWSGIDDDEALKRHILDLQEEAYEIHPYPCIRRLAFTKLKISRLPAYGQFLKLGKERPGAIFLDIGCCFGNDVRKVVADGFPIQGIIASDLKKEFWDMGYRLFNDSPQKFPVPFVHGDAFDPDHLPPVPPFLEPPSTPVPDLHSLTSLAPLLGHVSAIHASALFHLFEEAEQASLAHSIGGLLSPEPGSMIFGAHGAKDVKGYRNEAAYQWSGGQAMFCHSPESWTDLWNGEVFPKGTVEVKTFLKEVKRVELPKVDGEYLKFWLMEWSVTRL